MVFIKIEEINEVNFIRFNFSIFFIAGILEVKNKIQPEGKLMAEKKKHKKVDAQSKIEGDALLLASADKAVESVTSFLGIY